MWFNVLKNTARNRAYDSFIRSFILYDGISLKTEDLETVGTGLVRWYTPNRAFYWDLMRQDNWFPFQMTLGTTIAEHEPYLYFIEEAVREEYPDNWEVFSELIKKEKEEIAKLFQYEKEVEEEEEEPNEEFVLTKRAYREIRYIFAEFLDILKYKIDYSIIDFVPRGVRHNRIRRQIREIYSSTIPTANEIENQYKRIDSLYIHREKLQSLFTAAFRVFKGHIVNIYPYIIWEHISNIYAHFVKGMLEKIEGDTLEEQISYIFNNDMVTKTQMLMEEVLSGNDSDLNLLLEHLPLDRLAV